MPNKCCVPNCRGNYDKKEKVSAFSFPKAEELKRLWLEKINRPGFVPTRHTVVCEKHFDKFCIVRAEMYIDKHGVPVLMDKKTVSLTPNAIPSIFPPDPEIRQPSTNVESEESVYENIEIEEVKVKSSRWKSTKSKAKTKKKKSLKLKNTTRSKPTIINQTESPNTNNDERTELLINPTEWPDDIIKSLINTTNSLIGVTESPDDITESPNTTTKSPDDIIKSPINYIKSPNGNTKSPIKTTKSPNNTTELPINNIMKSHININTTKSPIINTIKSPINTIKSHINFTESHIDLTKLPLEIRKCIAGTTESPNDTATSHNETTKRKYPEHPTEMEMESSDSDFTREEINDDDNENNCDDNNNNSNIDPETEIDTEFNCDYNDNNSNSNMDSENDAEFLGYDKIQNFEHFSRSFRTHVDSTLWFYKSFKLKEDYYSCNAAKNKKRNVFDFASNTTPECWSFYYIEDTAENDSPPRLRCTIKVFNDMHVEIYNPKLGQVQNRISSWICKESSQSVLSSWSQFHTLLSHFSCESNLEKGNHRSL